MGYIYNTLFKYIIHKHNTRYVFEKEDREVIPIKGPLTELLGCLFTNLGCIKPKKY